METESELEKFSPKIQKYFTIHFTCGESCILSKVDCNYTLQIVCIFFVCEEANKTLNYLRLIANKANKIQRPIKIKIKASIKVPPALKRHFC